VAGRQPNAPAAFTPEEIPGTQFSEAESTSGHMVLSGVPRKKSPVTPPEIDPGTVRLVAQPLTTTLPQYLVVGRDIYSKVPYCTKQSWPKMLPEVPPDPGAN